MFVGNTLALAASLLVVDAAVVSPRGLLELNSATLTPRHVDEATNSPLSSVRRQTSPVVAYSGPEANFPTADKWISYDALFDLNAGACDNGGKGSTIKSIITDAGAIAGIDQRLILAMVLQETLCMLNPDVGLMSVGRGYDGTDQSIIDGIEEGVSGEFGIATLIHQFGERTFTGVRAYNSGAGGVDENNLSSTPAGTGSPDYCSDVANRLMGAIVA